MAPMVFTPILTLLLLLPFYALATSDVRRFIPAPKSSHLHRRGFDFEPRHGKHTLLYEDDSFIDSAARVHLIPKYPTLVLDDVQDHLRDVVCTQSDMTIHFHAKEAMESAAKLWDTKSEFLIFSTHTTCGSEGSHDPYIVRYKSCDHASGSIKFEAERKTFEETTHRISVDLGVHVLGDIKPKVVRRQASTTSKLPTTISSTNAQTASLPPSVSFNFQTPVSTATAAKASNNIDFAAINRSVLPPDQTIMNLFPGSKALEFVNLACKQCSMKGSVTLEAAGFDVNSTQVGSIIDFFDNGFFQFTTNKLAARMEIDLGLLPGFTNSIFTANLARFDLNPIAVGKIIQLGPAIELTVPIGVTLNSPVNLTTGFELTVPDNSKIIMNVSSITGSSQTGFDKTTFKSLPFSATSDNLSLNITAALRPKLIMSAGLGVKNSGFNVGGGFGAFMNFPRLTATVDTMQNVNTSCNGPAAQGTTNRAVRVSPSAVFDMGLHWELNLEFAGIDQSREGEQVLVSSKPILLPNQCLVFDSKTKSLTPADGSKSSASASGSGADKQGSASSLKNKAVHWYALSLVLTAVVFVSL